MKLKVIYIKFHKKTRKPKFWTLEVVKGFLNIGFYSASA